MIRSVTFTSSGRIEQVFVCSRSMAERQLEAMPADWQVAFDVPEWVNEDSAFIKDGEAVRKADWAIPRLLSISANGQDEAVITGIPDGVSVTWPDGQADEVTDGEVRFSVDLPGTYRLKFTAVEYLDKEVTVEAVAAA